jgi:hypothetical protein
LFIVLITIWSSIIITSLSFLLFSQQAESEEVARLKQIIKKLRAGQVVEDEDVVMMVEGPSATAAVEEDDKVYDGY